MNKGIFLFFTFIALFACKHEQNDQSNSVETIPSTPAEILYKTDALLGEGAFWNAKNEQLYWVDINKNQAHIFDPKTNTNQTFNAPSQVGTIIPITDHEVMLALVDGLYILNTLNGKIEPYMLVDHQGKNVRFNDGKADPSGRMWVGTLDLDFSSPIGRLYMFDNTGNIKKQNLEVTVSNGLVWNQAKDKMYYIDTPSRKIVSFDYNDENGEIQNEKTVVTIQEKYGLPDGMTIDEHDNLWVGMWNGSAVLCFDSNTGDILHKVDVPAYNVTSCAFGGKDFDQLYITTSTEDMSNKQKQDLPNAGSLFVADVGVKGVPSQHFIK